jgi:hypothetical protein
LYRDASCAIDTTVADIGDVTDEADNCSVGLDATYVDDLSGLTGCSNSGTYTRTWTLVDDCGNTTVKVQTITVMDTTPPVLTCPSDTILDCQNADTTVANLGSASAIDNCSLVKITHSDQVTPSNCAGFYSFVRTWVAEDSCGNISTCEQNVTLQDIQKPDFTFVPSNVLLDCDADTSASIHGYASATDNCAASVTITFTDDVIIQPGGCLLPSGFRRIWKATDDCGNFREAFQIFTYQDTTDPVITFCPPDTTVNCGEDTTTTNLGDVEAVDNCSNSVSITYVDQVTAGSCLGTYTFQRTWNVEDRCGNASTCVQMVTVQDTTVPVFTSCPQDTILNCVNADTTTASLGFPAATDNCGGNVSIVYSDQVTSFTCAGDFTFTRTFTATDACGLTSTCIQVVTVVDNIQISCPQDTAVCAYDQPFALGGGLPSGGAFSGTGVTNNIFDPSIAGPGDHVITYTYSVNYCCVHSCTLNIHVDAAIQVTCPTNMTVCESDQSLILSGGNPLGGTYSGTGVSNGAFDPQTAGIGVHTIEYAVSSSNGCISRCSFTIEVIADPVASCPASFEVCVSGQSVNLTGGTPAGGTYSGPGVTGSVFYPGTAGVGTHQIAYVVGNAGLCFDTCYFTATVYALPTVSCPNDTAVCIDAQAFGLAGGMPTGGTYSGTGVSGGMFNPTTAGQGVHTITYTYKDASNCTNQCTFTITLNPKPVVTCPANFAVCYDALPFQLSGATPAGGVYSGSGVTAGIFDPAAASGGVHTITYTYYDNNQCWNSCSFTIGVGPVIDAGPDTFIYIGDTYTFQPTAAGPTPMTYSWSPDLTLIDPNVANAVSWPIAPETFTLIVTDNTGCTATDQFFLDVRPRGNSISGQVVYDNNPKTPMPGYGVILTELTSQKKDTIVTRFNGLFDIDSLPDGTYMVGGTYLQQWPWGGVNATDALFVARHYAQFITLSPFRALAGDVDNSGFLNNTDALRISQRFAGLIPSFPVPDWLLESGTISFSGTPYLHTARFLTLAAGDVNGSYVPFSKISPFGKLESNGKQIVSSGMETSIPLTLNTSEALGAVSLQLILPEGVTLTDARMNQSLGGELHYTINGRVLNLAWVALDGPMLNADEPLMYLDLKTSQVSGAMRFVLGDVFEVADQDGSVIPDARLGVPELVTSATPLLWARNYPNPFSDVTTVEYFIPVDGKVSIEVFNLLGERLFSVLDEHQPAGEHSTEIRAFGLPTGSYYYQLRLDDGTTILTHKEKLIVVR